MTASYWSTALVTATAVVGCVALHYEGLRIIGRQLPLPSRNHRARIVALILSLLALHIAGIWIFGMEAISGLTLITWSASFTFLVMQRSWGFTGE